jgi:hypothetical protein
MRNIVITDGVDTVRLLSDLEFEWQPKIIGERATMASGKTVMDVTGVKNTLTVPTGWLSAVDLSKLKRMISQNVTLSVRWPSLDGDRTDECYIGMPLFKSFRYGQDGVELWYGVTLEIEQTGVDPVM